MTLYVHDLWGCTPSPLAHYLKALAVLRLVAAQKDPGARLWWQDEHARLATRLSSDELIEFLAVEYQPSPILDPWNGGSGFYDDEDKGLSPIERSTAPRLSGFVNAIKQIRADMETVGIVDARRELKRLDKLKASDAEAKAAFKEAETRFALLKADFLPRCRLRWRGEASSWFEAAVVIDGEGAPAYPALFGTGGNDGRLDFTNNFMQRLGDLFDLAGSAAAPRPPTRALARAALFGDRPVPDVPSTAIGQFLPGASGGANSGPGFDGKGITNPWDFVLMIEGGLCLRAGLTRRAAAESLPQAAAPFAIRNDSTGFATAADSESSTRGEQWFPLWGSPSTLDELTRFFAEGRMQVGARTGQRPVEAARAIGRLGVARGVSAFERVGYLERNGQSNLAVPLGRFRVAAHDRRELIDHTAEWLSGFASKARADLAPASWRRVARVTEEALLAVCQNSHDPSRWTRLARALAEADATLARTAKTAAEKNVRPLDKVPVGWIAALPQSPELRLALAFASQQPTCRIRTHLASLKGWRYDGGDAPEVVATSGDLLRDAVAIVRRRLTKHPAEFPLHGLDACAAPLEHVAAFLAGDVDDREIAALARLFCALDWEASRPPVARVPDDDLSDLGPYGLVRLTYLPHKHQRALGEVVGEAVVVEHLLAGRLAAAAATCTRRLTLGGRRPHVTRLVLDPHGARRLVASLTFPISLSSAGRLAARFTRNTTEASASSQE